MAKKQTGRRITIKIADPMTLEYDYSGVVLYDDGTEAPMPHQEFNWGAPSQPFKRPETYGNLLFNGPTTVVDPYGNQTQYGEEGCHLVKRELGVIESKSDAEYAKFTERPGSENES